MAHGIFLPSTHLDCHIGKINPLSKGVLRLNETEKREKGGVLHTLPKRRHHCYPRPVCSPSGFKCKAWTSRWLRGGWPSGCWGPLWGWLLGEQRPPCGSPRGKREKIKEWRPCSGEGGGRRRHNFDQLFLYLTTPREIAPYILKKQKFYERKDYKS